MTNDELKSIISDVVGDDEEILNEIIVLEGDEFADGAVGLTQDYHVVYDYNRLVDSLMRHNSWTAEDAIEWIEYNTLRAIPYMSSQGNEPIVLISMFSDEVAAFGTNDEGEDKDES